MELWEAALEYLGVPFGHRGRSRNRLDCVGLVILAARDAGLENIRDLRIYGREPVGAILRSGLIDHLGTPKPDKVLAPNDIVLMRLHRGSEPSHVGIIAPHRFGLGLIHAHSAAKKVVFHRIDEVWTNRISEVFAWRGKL